MNTIKARSRILSLTLAVSLLLGMTLYLPGPLDVHAVEIGTADKLVEGQRVYFGSEGNAYTTHSSDPGMGWVVLELGNDEAWLFAEDVLFYNGSVLYKAFQSSGKPQDADFENQWEYSELRQWLNDQYLSNAFTGRERDAINETKHETEREKNSEWGGSGTMYSHNAHIFLLDLKDVSIGGKANDSTLLRASANWWLRSPGNFDNCAAVVASVGIVLSLGSPVSHSLMGIRPAFRLNLSSVIFTSAAEGGKSDLNVADGLVDATTVSGNDAIKLTVEDSSLNLSGGVTPTSVDDRTITFSYDGAASGKTLSAIVTDSSGLKYYGQLAANIAANGNAIATVPEGFTTGDTLEIFVEEINSDYKTDFAGARIEIPIQSQTAPTTPQGVAETATGNDGKITSVDDTMEYRKSGETDWTAVDANKTEITDLAAGNYEVRYAGKVESNTTAYLASPAKTITVDAYLAPTLTMKPNDITLQVGKHTNGDIVAKAEIDNFSGNNLVRFSIDGPQLPAGLGIDDTTGTITVTNADALEETTKDTYTVKAVHNTEEATDDIEITILAADAPSPPPDTPDGPKVYADTLTVTKGDTATFQISLGQSGNMAATADIASDDESIATATPTHITPDMADTVTVKGISKGNATITVTFSGGDLASPTDAKVKVTVQDSSGGNPDEPDEPKPPVTDPDGGGNGGSGGSTGGGSSSSRSRSSSSSSRSNTTTAKTQLPASAFNWDGRTLTIDHDSISVLGLQSIQWNGQTLARGADYGVYTGSVIVRFGEDFMAAQSPGDHTVRVEFLNHTGETTVTVGGAEQAAGEAGGGLYDNDTHNPSTGGYPTDYTGATDNPNTGGGANIWTSLLFGSLGGGVIMIYGSKLKVR